MVKKQSPNEWFTEQNRKRLAISEKTPLVGMGFTNIFYKGKPVERDLTPKTEYIILARNRLHRWWLTKIRRFPADKVFLVSYLKGDFDFTVDLNNSMPVNAGRVVKATAHAEFTPDVPRSKAGRVVRTMPRQLRKIKEGQEGDA